MHSSQTGSMNLLLVPLILSIVMLLCALGFGAWAFSSRQDYKNNSDEKAEKAATIAVEQAKTEKDNEFLQREKEPYKIYTAPAQYGSFSFEYPKTWSGYADEQSNQLTIYMQPDVVSSNSKTAYALKIEVIGQAYANVIRPLDNNIRQGKIKAYAYNLPKVPSVLGLRVDGEVDFGKQGSAIYLPIRDKTLRIVSEAPDKVPDLNNIILPNFQYIP